jgi:hypothetical protein
VVHVRPTTFLDNPLFTTLAAAGLSPCARKQFYLG